MNRVVDPPQIDETTVVSWDDVDHLRATVSEFLPTMIWAEDGTEGNDCSDASPIRAVSLPAPDQPHAPLVVRASQHASSVVNLIELGERLECLVYDTQTGDIVYQPT